MAAITTIEKAGGRCSVRVVHTTIPFSPSIAFRILLDFYKRNRKSVKATYLISGERVKDEEKMDVDAEAVAGAREVVLLPEERFKGM